MDICCILYFQANFKIILTKKVKLFSIIWLPWWLSVKKPWWLSVKKPLPMQEARVQSLGQEDPLEEEMATHSSILAWGTPWTEEPGGLWSMGSIKSQT